MAKAKNMTQKQVGLTYGFRSGLEEKIAQQLEENGIKPCFESLKLPFVEHKNRTYTPDFPVKVYREKKPDGAIKGIVIETKGRFLTADRMKMLSVKDQYPYIDFRFVFSNSKARISKVSQTTYGRWCEKNGFKYADKLIPDEWIREIKEN